MKKNTENKLLIFIIKLMHRNVELRPESVSKKSGMWKLSSEYQKLVSKNTPKIIIKIQYSKNQWNCGLQNFSIK